MNFFGFGGGPEIEIFFDDEDKRKTAEIRTEDGGRERHVVYHDGETISGKVQITLRRSGSKLEHQGIRIDLFGQSEVCYERASPHNFLFSYQELARPGDLLKSQTFHFEFPNAQKKYESYTATNCRLRYFVRVSVLKRLTDIIKDRDFIVHTLSMYPDVNSSIKMEVGIEDCLHIEFEYNRSKYHLNDVIVGKIYFLLVRIKIKTMEVSIIKKEIVGFGANTYTENEIIAKHEIMDGAPVRGESIPLRIFLGAYDLTPTMRDVDKKFSVRYYLNLVLIDEEERRYFKQQEIILWRKAEKTRRTFQSDLQRQFKEMQNPNVQFTTSIDNNDAEPGPSSAITGTKPTGRVQRHSGGMPTYEKVRRDDDYDQYNEGANDSNEKDVIEPDEKVDTGKQAIEKEKHSANAAINSEAQDSDADEDKLGRKKSVNTDDDGSQIIKTKIPFFSKRNVVGNAIHGENFQQDINVAALIEVPITLEIPPPKVDKESSGATAALSEISCTNENNQNEVQPKRSIPNGTDKNLQDDPNTDSTIADGIRQF